MGRATYAIDGVPATEVSGREFRRGRYRRGGFDEVHPDLTADAGVHIMAVGQFVVERGVRRRFGHGPFDLDCVLAGHTFSYFAQAALRECEDFGLTSRPDGDCMLEMTA